MTEYSLEFIAFVERKKLKSLSHARLFVTPWVVACTKLLHPWDFPGKSTGVGCHCLLRNITLVYANYVTQSF